MHVVATAGHVDHGKSTLVRALTGTDPDRLDEERRRGLTIELGYAWTTLPGADQPVAFVDVPGHERFVPTMLAGVGPVPAVLLVVAADDPWMPQAAEHLAAIDALGVRHAVVAVTRSDLADPGPAIGRTRERVRRTSLGDAPVVPVSAATGAGLDALTNALAAMTAALPQPDPSADVRLWVDRRFAMPGAGTVVTGTLPAGTVRVGDRLQAGNGQVRVRSMQALGTDVDAAVGTARVALRFGAHHGTEPARGTVLLTPDAWRPTTIVDVRLYGEGTPPQRPMLHLGAGATGCHLRLLGDGAARLTTDAALPLRVGDRALLRDPGDRSLWGVTVLDPSPPPLRRRGAGKHRAAELAEHDGTPDIVAELRRRGVVRRSTLRAVGVDPAAAPAAALAAGDWIVDGALVPGLRARLAALVAEAARDDVGTPGISLDAARQALDLPDRRLVALLVASPLRLDGGRVVAETGPALPRALCQALDALDAELPDGAFQAPAADRLTALGLGPRELAAAERAGRLQRLADGVVLRPSALAQAVQVLAGLPQPFTTAQARTALGTSRRVAIPLLELLDRRGATRRLPDDRRELVPR